MTYAEKLLRMQLKAQQLCNWKFHRQKPLFVYKDHVGNDRRVIADFYHHPSKVVIEVDGSIHDLDHIQQHDELRTQQLHQRCYAVVRYTNDQVIWNIDAVIKDIQRVVIERLNSR
jgi:cyclase